jgi:ribosomal protein RSM22 (predicted rRNA methylase)
MRDPAELFSLLAPSELPPGALEALRQTFLAHETNGARYLDTPSWLEAYRAFFFPQTFSKMRSVLEEIKRATPSFDPKVVVDLGAAMTPAGFAAWHVFSPKEIHALDFSADALADASKLATRLSAPVRTHAHDLKAGWAPSLPARADLILVANALSELETLQSRTALVWDLLAHRLTPNGAVVLMEPADRVHARDLQTLRDALRAGGTTPRLPCPHDGPCPALSRERDFCHDARALEMPTWFAPLAERAGLSDARMRFSYLVYMEGPRVERGTLRVLSHPIEDKGRMRFFACGEQGLLELMRQNKHKSSSNQGFDTLSRGDLLRVTGVDYSGDVPVRAKISATSGISRV